VVKAAVTAAVPAVAPAPLNPAASPVRGPAVTMPARATSGATTPGIAALGVAG